MPKHFLNYMKNAKGCILSLKGTVKFCENNGGLKVETIRFREDFLLRIGMASDLIPFFWVLISSDLIPFFVAL